MKRRDLIIFLERLELYIAAGLGPGAALKLIEQGLDQRQAAATSKIRAIVEAGGLLSRAMSIHIKVPATPAGLIAHGESSGGLAKALGAARSLLEREEELKKKVISAMIYPVTIGIFASALTIGLMRGIMPQIVPLLKSLHVHLPFITRAVMAVSDYLLHYGIYTLFSFLFSSAASIILYRRSGIIRRFVHRIVSISPIIGSLARSHALSVFLLSCGSLISSGISADRAYRETSGITAFMPVRDILASSAEAVSRGAPIGEALRHKRVPAYIASLVSAGEASGTLGASMLRAAAILERDIEHSLKRLTALIEPSMMAGMGAIVGGIALSIMMPIYDISKVLQK